MAHNAANAIICWGEWGAAGGKLHKIMVGNQCVINKGVNLDFKLSFFPIYLPFNLLGTRTE